MGPVGTRPSRGASSVSYNGSSVGVAGAVRTGSVMTATLPGLPSRLFLSAGQDGDWNRDVAKRQQHRHERGEVTDQPVGARGIPAQGLEQASDAMPQVQANRNHYQHV